MCVSFWVIFFPVTGLMGQKMLLTVLWFSNYLFIAYASVSLRVKWGQVAPFIAGLWQRVDKPPRLASSEQLQRMLTVVVLLVGNACPGIFFCSDVLLIKHQKECLTARANGFPHMPKAFVQMIWSLCYYLPSWLSLSLVGKSAGFGTGDHHKLYLQWALTVVLEMWRGQKKRRKSY